MKQLRTRLHLQHMLSLGIASTALVTVSTPATAQVDGRMFRYPAVSATQVAFVYAGDVWIAPKNGGVASRIAGPRGEEQFPRFSPDGKSLAFSANYDGNVDIYVMPTAGGEPVRVTHHPGVDRLISWTPDGNLLFATGMQSGSNRFNQLYTVSPKGGLPKKLPVPYGEFGAISADGKTLAYQPKSEDFRTWKRYRGGDASDIWTFDLTSYASENVTKFEGNDSQPMWYGTTMFFISDRGPDLRNNLWSYDTKTKAFKQHTHYTDYDISFPSIGPSDIVFQAGGTLYLFDLKTEQAKPVKYEVLTDLATLRPHVGRVTNNLGTSSISPSGVRAVFEARGDVFTVPAENGPVRNITNSAGVFERFPRWSPDGKSIAYWSDRSGEYELYVRDADGTGNERKVTSLGAGFRYTPFWSPDSKQIAFIDAAMRIHAIDVATGKVREVGKQLYALYGGANGWQPTWSKDSRWLAWSQDLEGQRSAISMWDSKTGKTAQATSGFYNDGNPVFDPEGKYLYYTSNRSMSPSYSAMDNSWAYVNATMIIAAPLRADVASPLGPRSDEEKGPGAAPSTPPTPPSGAAPQTPKPAVPVEIEVEGLESRGVVMPIRAGNFAFIDAVPGKLLFGRAPNTGSADSTVAVMSWDLKERREDPIIEDVNSFEVSADGKKALVSGRGNRYGVINVAARQRIEKPMRLDEMEALIDPRAEWKQMFADAWRFERDMFYDPKMHGVDWNAVRTSYSKVLEGAVTRWDVNFVLGEMIGELNSSHTYRSGGDLEAEPSRNVGMLGVDWALENGAYRIAKIIRAAPWDIDARSPLAQPGINVSEGDYVLEVNGVRLDPSRSPWAPFEGLAGRTVELLVNNKPTTEGARTVLVQTIGNEFRLRSLAWVEDNRKRVLAASGGRIGYVYVPNTGVDGQTELVRQFHGQRAMDALIIDERFNSGGQIPDRFIELLNRPPLAFWAVRDGADWQWPPAGHFGPKAMLINGWSGSGGDAFPYYFRSAKIGPVIGQRTWGGLIGISGAPPLIDGGSVTVPTFRMYSPQGEWFPEGHGVEPDIEVVDNPTEMARGKDPQLDRAVEVLMKELKDGKLPVAKRPPAQNRGH